MNSINKIPEIRSQAFVIAREKRGLSVQDLANLACLSTKQIQQIENGRRDAFYTPAIKFLAAKKVAVILNLEEQEAFDLVLPNEPEPIEQPITEVAANAKAVPSVATPVEAITLKESLEAPPNVNLESMQSKAIASEEKKSSNKLVWLIPIAAIVFVAIQFKPLIEEELDIFMAKTAVQPAPVIASAPPIVAAPAPDAVPVNAAPPAPVLAEASPVPVAAPSATLASGGSACPPAEVSLENYKPPYANKAGDMVYVKTSTKQVVCVVDATGVTQTKVIEPGAGNSFYGKPPFTLLTSGLASAEVYFQGLRVRPANPDAKTILLVQAD